MPRQTAEQIFAGMLRGPLVTKAVSATNQWAGLTTLSSGSATVTVSTTSVASDSIIQFSARAAANQSSGTYRPIEVKSINPGVAFSFGVSDGVAIPRDTTLMWQIIKTN